MADASLPGDADACASSGQRTNEGTDEGTDEGTKNEMKTIRGPVIAAIAAFAFGRPIQDTTRATQASR